MPAERQTPDAHWSVDLEPSEDGWYVPKCQCGWEWSPVPDAETAADALMDHAYEAGVRDAKANRV